MIQSVIPQLQHRPLAVCASGAGFVAKQAEDRKMRTYQDLNANHIFIPIAI